MAVNFGVERGPSGQRVGRIKMLPRLESLALARLQTNVHLTAQDKNPLRRTRAMKLALKAHGTFSELVARTGLERRQSSLGLALAQRHLLGFELSVTTL